MSGTWCSFHFVVHDAVQDTEEQLNNELTSQQCNVDWLDWWYIQNYANALGTRTPMKKSSHKSDNLKSHKLSFAPAKYHYQHPKNYSI